MKRRQAGHRPVGDRTPTCPAGNVWEWRAAGHPTGTRCAAFRGPRWRAGSVEGRRGERGIAMVAILSTLLIVTMVSVALIGIMNTDLTHSTIQYAVSRSYYVAQAGLEEVKAQLWAAPDPAAYTTPAAGVTVPYGSGRFTYWVDSGPATGCSDGLKTLDALGQVEQLGRTFSTRVRACGAPGTPFLAALFGVSRIQFQGAESRMYLAPYLVGTPGGGGQPGVLYGGSFL